MSKRMDALLDFWAKNNMNVILEGKHGFGKTAMVEATFKRLGWNCKYFSASTMDPWVDFVGVPKEHTDEVGNSYLELVRPKEFQYDEYDAIFFDEFNRSPKKVRNAVMELIQFKSINGRKFNNLKVVWAAINPHDEEETYDVEKLDPAQIDRFHVHFVVPSVPDKDYFYSRYGHEVGKAAIEWWNAIPDKARELVSARRLEYVIDTFLIGGDIKYLVHKSTNPSKLLMVLNSGSLVERLKAILTSKDKDSLKAFLKQDNHFEVAVDLMRHEPGAIAAIVPFLDEERLMRLTHDINGVKDFITNEDNIDQYADMLRAVVNSGTLGDKEEARLRAVLGRGVSTTSDGIVIYEPNPANATVTPDEFYSAVKNLVVSLQTADEETLHEAYTLLSMNLCEPRAMTESLDVLTVIFRLVERSKHDMIVTRYTKTIPMINYILEYIKVNGLDINSQPVRVLFSQGKRKINTVKVQGFLDTYHDSLTTKPRIM